MSALPTPKSGTGLMTIAFDLDGTLAEPTWPSPDIGAPITRAVDAAIEYRHQGYEVIIFTSRPRSHFDNISLWIQDNGLDDVFYDIVTDKPRAAMYVDDRAVAFPEAFGVDDFGPVAIGQRVIDNMGVTSASFTVRGKEHDYLVAVQRNCMPGFGCARDD